jgi:hypothetical protein
MDKRYMKRCLISLVIREYKWKPSITLYPLGMLIMNKTEITRDEEKRQCLYSVDGNVEYYTHNVDYT